MGPRRAPRARRRRRHLTGLLALFREKFPVDDVGHVVRALSYFGDADAEPLPLGLIPERWRAIRSAFRARVKAL